MTTFVTATEWGVSYTVAHNPLPGEAPVRLNVHKTLDEVNRWGGRGVVVTHPDFDGERFQTSDEAQQYALQAGLLRPFVMDTCQFCDRPAPRNEDDSKGSCGICWMSR